MHNDKIFTLQLKDVPICDIKIENGQIIGIIDIYQKEFAPVESYIFDEINGKRLDDWLTSRAIPVNRDGIDQIISRLKIKNLKEYLMEHLALSLSDQYWLKPRNLNVAWKDVNLFQNDYNVLEFADATFEKDSDLYASIKKHQLRTSMLYHPNASLGGELKKLWMFVDGSHYLVKSSNTIYHLEPIHERLAKKIADVLEVSAVDYSVFEIKGKRVNRLVSICKDMVDENEHIVSAYSVVRGFPEARIQDYPSYIDFLENELNIENARIDVQKMILLDFIMLNEDRHLNNFGVIRNSNTLRWECVCPIFDTGKSLNTNVSREYWDFCDGEIKDFDGEMVDASQLMDHVDCKISNDTFIKLYELSKWYKEKLMAYQKLLRLSDEEIEAFVSGYQKRIDVFQTKMIEKDLIVGM